MEGELQGDWEVVVQSSGSTREDSNSNENDVDDDDGTQGMITFDYFSLENNSDLRRVDAIDEDGSVQSGSPGWIEPRSDAPYGPKQFSELWSDSSSDRLDEQRLVDDDELSNELGLEDSGRNAVETSESIATEKHLGEIDLVSSDTERAVESPISIDPSVKSGGGGGGGGGGEEKGFVVWWKIPIEMLKYCVFRANPVWSFSMAAAVVGFVMLGRRLYNMKKKKKKKKSSTLQLKVLLDDKKVVNYTARLNDAISVVKRVPMIRPALPSSVGTNQWSMMSLR